MTKTPIVRRDEKGRPIGRDGYPLGGLATIPEFAAATAIGVSTTYALIVSGEIPAKRIGRSRRIEWRVIRDRFLDSEPVEAA